MVWPDRFGRYELFDLTPREYLVVATRTTEPDFPAVTVLESLAARGVRVRIDRPGETTLDLIAR